MDDHESTAVLKTTLTAFEAETIAAALRERGIDARVLDVAGNMVWGVPISGVKVVVMERDLEAARKVLDEIKVDSASIDWDSADLGDESEANKLLQYNKTRRWMLTLVIMLVPIGLFVLSFSVMRGDPYLKILGGVLLITAMMLGWNFFMSPKRPD